MQPAIAVMHRLYLKQVEGAREGGALEVVPVSFNYQDFIVVATGTVPWQGEEYVFQTHSCGCGPQPLIRGGRLQRRLAWPDSALCRRLRAAAAAKDRALVEQQVVKEVYLVDCDEPAAIQQALAQVFPGKKISLFGREE